MKEPLMESDNSHGWRYGYRPYPAPDGIRVRIELRGNKAPMVSEHAGRMFYKMNAGYFGVIDPANGGSPLSLIERGMIRRIEIEAI